MAPATSRTFAGDRRPRPPSAVSCRLPGADYDGKDGNPLNEGRIVCDSLMNNKGILRGDKQIKLTPEKSVLKLNTGDRIRLTEAEFGRLSAAFFAELVRRFG